MIKLEYFVDKNEVHQCPVATNWIKENEHLIPIPVLKGLNYMHQNLIYGRIELYEESDNICWIYLVPNEFSGRESVKVMFPSEKKYLHFKFSYDAYCFVSMGKDYPNVRTSKKEIEIGSSFNDDPLLAKDVCEDIIRQIKMTTYDFFWMGTMKPIY